MEAGTKGWYAAADEKKGRPEHLVFKRVPLSQVRGSRGAKTALAVCQECHHQQSLCVDDLRYCRRAPFCALNMQSTSRVPGARLCQLGPSPRPRDRGKDHGTVWHVARPSRGSLCCGVHRGWCACAELSKTVLYDAHWWCETAVARAAQRPAVHRCWTHAGKEWLSTFAVCAATEHRRQVSICLLKAPDKGCRRTALRLTRFGENGSCPAPKPDRKHS